MPKFKKIIYFDTSASLRKEDLAMAARDRLDSFLRQVLHSYPEADITLHWEEVDEKSK